jgi:hypothetical protein
MTFYVARTIFPLPVRHIFWFTLDLRVFGAGSFIMDIDVIDVDHETGASCRERAWGFQFKVWSDAVQPNDQFAGPNLSVNSLAVLSAVNAAGGESKSVYKEVVRGGDIRVNENWNDRLGFWHRCPFVEGKTAWATVSVQEGRFVVTKPTETGSRRRLALPESGALEDRMPNGHR